jgi:hypothetical protein
MPRKTKIEPEPEGAEEIETVEPQEETKEELSSHRRNLSKAEGILLYQNPNLGIRYSYFGQ